MVLGDSNLKLDLPHGVQEHTIAKAVVHEDYDAGDSVHHNDIGTVCQEIGVTNNHLFARICVAEVPGEAGGLRVSAVSTQARCGH